MKKWLKKYYFLNIIKFGGIPLENDSQISMLESLSVGDGVSITSIVTRVNIQFSYVDLNLYV